MSDDAEESKIETIQDLLDSIDVDEMSSRDTRRLVLALVSAVDSLQEVDRRLAETILKLLRRVKRIEQRMGPGNNSAS